MKSSLALAMGLAGIITYNTATAQETVQSGQTSTARTESQKELLRRFTGHPCKEYRDSTIRALAKEGHDYCWTAEFKTPNNKRLVEIIAATGDYCVFFDYIRRGNVLERTGAGNCPEELTRENNK